MAYAEEERSEDGNTVLVAHCTCAFTSPFYMSPVAGQLSTMPVATDTANVHLLLLAIFDRDCAL